MTVMDITFRKFVDAVGFISGVAEAGMRVSRHRALHRAVRNLSIGIGLFETKERWIRLSTEDGYCSDAKVQRDHR